MNLNHRARKTLEFSDKQYVERLIDTITNLSWYKLGLAKQKAKKTAEMEYLDYDIEALCL